MIDKGRLIEELKIKEPSRLAILENTLSASNELQRCEKIVKKDGLLIEDRFKQKIKHPLLETIRNCRKQIQQGMQLLRGTRRFQFIK